RQELAVGRKVERVQPVRRGSKLADNLCGVHVPLGQPAAAGAGPSRDERLAVAREHHGADDRGGPRTAAQKLAAVRFPELNLRTPAEGVAAARGHDLAVGRKGDDGGQRKGCPPPFYLPQFLARGHVPALQLMLNAVRATDQLLAVGRESDG